MRARGDAVWLSDDGAIWVRSLSPLVLGVVFPRDGS